MFSTNVQGMKCIEVDAPHMDGEYNAKNPGSLANRRTGRSWTPLLSGVAYVQGIKDITIHGESLGTHFEPGIWVRCLRAPLPNRLETVERNAASPGAIYVPPDIRRTRPREAEVIQRVRRSALTKK